MNDDLGNPPEVADFFVAPGSRERYPSKRAEDFARRANDIHRARVLSLLLIVLIEAFAISVLWFHRDMLEDRSPQHQSTQQNSPREGAAAGR